jgi:signal transduction histidine kinase
VAVSVRCTPGGLEIDVTDDGTGIDPAAARDERFGLTGIRERVDLLGGEVRIQPGPTAGTVVSVRLPLG